MIGNVVVGKVVWLTRDPAFNQQRRSRWDLLVSSNTYLQKFNLQLKRFVKVRVQRGLLDLCRLLRAVKQSVGQEFHNHEWIAQTYEVDETHETIGVELARSK